MSIKTAFLAMAASTVFATAAQAHTHLVSSTPAQDASVTPPTTIELQFSERLEPKFSKVKLSKADGTPVAASSSVIGKDRKTILGKPSKPLGAGAYAVNWQVVSADGHKMTGSYKFAVK